ncbi:helicase associated domain-containing protein [Priestia filamentosa]|uniref:helicase associated domain-containing protein n=1 Tax=Priestia filamentosa TaxID=1402861 RepID=UPI00397D0C22
MNRNNALWEQHYEKLVNFKQQHSHTLVPQDFEEDKTFAKWVATQRYQNNKGLLEEDKVKKLDEIDFIWDVGEYKWNEYFKALKEFRKENGHVQVPISFVKEEIPLGRWLANQKSGYKRNTLTEEKVEKLKELGAIGTTYKGDWEQGFNALSNFKKQYGHCNVTRKRDSKDYEYNKLANWIQAQRQLYKKNMLDKDQITQLEELGFKWVLRERVGWDGKYQMLLEYYNQHGDCLVPQGKEEYKSLGNWVNQQRVAYHNKNLSQEKIRKLEKLDFIWDVKVIEDSASWENKYEELVDYYNQHGHCLVPIGKEEYGSLGNWVSTQRTAYRNKILSEERIQKLKELDFVWNVRPKFGWENKYQMLVDYYNQHGHCLVSKNQKGYEGLASWITRQRAAYRNKTLPEERIQKLEEIGFVWTRTRAPKNNG